MHTIFRIRLNEAIRRLAAVIDVFQSDYALDGCQDEAIDETGGTG